MTEQVIEHFSALIWGLILGGIAGWIAWRRGFFHLSDSSTTSQIAYYDVIRTFFIFLSIEILVAPIAAVIYFSIREGHFISGNFDTLLTHHSYGWLNLLAILSGAAGVLLSVHWMDAVKKKSIWGDNKIRLKSFLLGSVSWFMIYPIVLAIGQIVWLSLFAFGIESDIDQVAVKHLKQVSSYPMLLATTVTVIVFLVPIVEELLFRGLLQSWLIAKWGIKKGIGLTSVIFALFHFSFSQGIANIELIISLFILSCFLGFLYVKQRSLWASIGLHTTFNALSSFLLIFAESNH